MAINPVPAYPHQTKLLRFIRAPFIAIVCLLILLYYSTISESTYTQHNRLRGSNALDANSLSNIKMPTFDITKPTVNHLIIVAGHAVLKINKISTADWSDSSWYLLSYQKNVGFPEIIFSHIKEGVSQASKDLNSILIFSGGQTR